MKEKTATIIGATGLIGNHLLELLQNDHDYSRIKVIVRRPVSFNHPKVQVAMIDFSDKEAFKSVISGSDVVFCAVGTTNQKMKGDKRAYREVDFDIPVNAASFCAETGCPHFAVVSSVGANPNGSNFYIRLKGEVEDRISRMNIQSISVFRPSLLLGKRQEFRLGEQIAKAIFKPLSFLLPSKFRPIAAYDVARSMIAAVQNDLPGFHIFHFREMRQLNASHTQ
jgi:uncharacterized protein YbjT (DUF2867 family)